MARANETSFRQMLNRTVAEFVIKDFANLNREVGEKIISPVFWVSNTSWQIELYPVGFREAVSDFISLYLLKFSGRDPTLTSVTFTIKIDDREIETFSLEHTYTEKLIYGYEKFTERQELLEQLTPDSPDVTVVCSVRVLDNIQKDIATQVELDKGVKNLVKDFENIFRTQKHSDVKINVGSKVFLVHKTLLAARWPTFTAMFEHKTAENETGIVNITDCESDIFELFLMYLYTGKVKKITNINTLDLYVTADKYCLDDLKEICCDLLSENLEINTVCDVLELAIDKNETDLSRAAIEFFTDNAANIYSSEVWKEWIRSKPDKITEILIRMAAFTASRQQNVNR